MERDPVPNLSRFRGERTLRSQDFGRMIRYMPGAVARPRSVEEVSGIVRRAAMDEVPVAVRGGGHSQGGQSLTDGGVVLDTVWLNRVEPLGRDLVRAQGGARWGAVVDALQGTRTLPRILVDVAEATVGGTLSAGGLGTTSHRYGVQVAQIEQLEVVIGTGERVRCSRTRNRNLFDAARGGQGLFGVITEAWIRLRRSGGRIRQYGIRYRDFDRFASDFERLVVEDRVDHVRAEVRLHDREIILGAGVEYDEHHDDRRVLEGLGYDEVATVRDTDKVAQAWMYPRLAFSQRNYHPWRDWFMPWETLRTLLDQPWLDSRWVPRAPWSWIGGYPIATGAIDAPLFVHPRGERMVSYSILSVLDAYEKANELAGRLKEVSAALLELGGKSYPSGGLRYGREEWKEHFAETFEAGVGWKRNFDPHRVFRRQGMPFGDSLAPRGGTG